MKKIKLAIALYLCAGMGLMQGQNEQWVVPPTNYNMNSTPVATTISGASSAGTSATNGAYDSNGKLLFYVSNLNLYVPGSSATLGKLPVDFYSPTSTGGTEVEIVPVPGQEMCNKFFVIYTCGSQTNMTSLVWCEVDFNGGSPLVTPSLGTKIDINHSPQNELLYDFPFIQGLAVTKLNSANNRYLLALGTSDEGDFNSGGIYRFTISSTGISKIYGMAATNMNMGTNNEGYFQWSLDYTQTNQLTLSADQSRVSWGGGTGGQPNPQMVFEVGLNGAYQFQWYQKYYLGGIGTADYFVSGVAYDSQDNLYASTQSGIYYKNSSTNSTFAKVANSQVYTKNTLSSQTGSQLEYVPASNLIVGVAPTSTDGVGKFFSITPVSCNINASYLSGQVKTNGNGGFTLSDQVDGDQINYPSLTAAITAPAAICQGFYIMANATYTGNTTPNYYYVEIDQCSDQWGNNPTQISAAWYPGVPANPLKIPGSNVLTCGNYYRVVFAVQNTAVCFNWSAAAAITYINCNPVPVVTGTQKICLGGSTTLTESYPAQSPYTMTWWQDYTNGNDPLQISTAQSVTVSPTVTTTYAVSVTDASTGCTGSTHDIVTVQNITPKFTLTSSLNSSDDHFFNMTASSYTYLNTTMDPTFKANWAVKEVAVGSTSPYVVVAPGSSEVDGSSYWTGLAGAPNVFAGYQTNLNPPYNSYGPGTNLGTNVPSPGVFRTGHEYCVTLTTSTTTCPNVPPLSLTAYQSCAGCRTLATGSPETENQDTPFDISIYPNPSNGIFTVETLEKGASLIQVFDLTGRMVISQTLNGTAQLDGSNLLAGTYLVKVTNSNTVVNKRIVITK